MSIKLPFGYELISPFSTGNNSDIFLVKELASEKKYLLKVLKNQIHKNKSETLNLKLRFKNEIDIVSTLNHENIARLQHSFSDGENFSLLYSYTEGNTLAVLLAEKKNFSVDTSLFIIEQLLDSLDYIHSKGIVHCDINPNNIFISLNNKLELFDFGISIHDNSLRKSSLGIEGTIPYLAPEQTNFTEFKVDNRTDLFAVGIIFYRLLSNNLPYNNLKSVKDYIEQLLQTELEPIRDQSIAFNQIVFKALNANPEERYQTADGFKYDLIQAKSISEGTDSEISIGVKDKVLAATRTNFFVGRELRVTTLIEGLNKLKINKGSSYLIYGISGIGKTEIVREFQKNITQDFISISIKCNVYSASQPFSVIKMGILEIISHINNQGIQYIEKCRKVLSKSLSEYSGVICNNIPELMPFFYTVNEDVSVEREQERLKHVYHLVLSELSKFNKVIFYVDDIQWMDDTSFNVLRKSIDVKSNILLIFNYRTKSQNEEPVLYRTSLIEYGFDSVFKIEPFSNRELRHYILNCFDPLENKDELIRTLALKTDNTPFSYSEAIRMLVGEKIIKPLKEGWYFDAEGWLASAKNLDPVTLVKRKFGIANDEQKEYLQLASFFGGKFNPQILNELLDLTDIESESTLEHIERLMFVTKGLHKEYNFIHDKIHETIANNVSSEKKMFWHEKIGNWFNNDAIKK